MTSESLNHRLIMFVGPPGSGKSTLSRWLSEELARRGIPATLLPEEEVYQLEALQPFTQTWNRREPGAITTLLDAVQSLCDEWKASNAVWITDQFLPAFHWLLGTYPVEKVQAYARALAPILHPLQPLLVSLQADVRESWRRAVAQRGQEWSDWMVDIFSSRNNVPLYSGSPIQDLDSLLDFLIWGQFQANALLPLWPEPTLSLETTETPLDQLETALLRHLGLSRRGHSSRPPG